MNLYINTYGTAKVNLSDSAIADKIYEIFDLRPKAIENRLKLRNPIYRETAAYGHMGRIPETVTKTFKDSNRKEISCEVELFTWEKTDMVEKIQTVFGL
jgi:S-adenosylmethionine synthetase